MIEHQSMQITNRCFPNPPHCYTVPPHYIRHHPHQRSLRRHRSPDPSDFLKEKVEEAVTLRSTPEVSLEQ